MDKTKKKKAAPAAAPAATPAKRKQRKAQVVSKAVAADKKNGDSRKTRVSRLVSTVVLLVLCVDYFTISVSSDMAVFFI